MRSSNFWGGSRDTNTVPNFKWTLQPWLWIGSRLGERGTFWTGNEPRAISGGKASMASPGHTRLDWSSNFLRNRCFSAYTANGSPFHILTTNWTTDKQEIYQIVYIPVLPFPLKSSWQDTQHVTVYLFLDVFNDKLKWLA